MDGFENLISTWQITCFVRCLYDNKNPFNYAHTYIYEIKALPQIDNAKFHHEFLSISMSKNATLKSNQERVRCIKITFAVVLINVIKFEVIRIIWLKHWWEEEGGQGAWTRMTMLSTRMLCFIFFNYMFVESLVVTQNCHSIWCILSKEYTKWERRATMKAFLLDAETLCSQKTPHLSSSISREIFHFTWNI